MKPHRLVEAFILAIICAVFIALLFTGSLDGLENRTIDWRHRHRSPQEPKAKIILVYITDECLEQLGSWPLSRSNYAKIIDKLSAVGANTIAFDIVFEGSSTADPTGDEEFIAACRKFGHVILPLVFTEHKALGNASSEQQTFECVMYPFEALASVASGFGYINVDFDYLNPDGVIQKIFLAHLFEDEWYPCFALAIAEEVAGKKFVVSDKGVFFGNQQLPVIDLPPLKPPKNLWHTETGKSVYVNFLGNKQQESFPIYSFADIVQGRFEPAAFQGAVVLVGPSAVGLGDLQLTPHGLKPGLITHANLLENILAANFIKAPSLNVQAGIISVISLIVLAILSWEGLFISSTFVFAMILSAYSLLCFILFSHLQLALPMTIPSLMALTQYVVIRFTQLITSLQQANNILRTQNIELDQKVQELTILHNAGSVLPAILDINSLANKVISTFCDLRNATAGLLIAFDTENGMPLPLGQISDGSDAFSKERNTELEEHLKSMTVEKRQISIIDSQLYTTYLPIFVGDLCWGAVCLRDPADLKSSYSESFWQTLLGISGIALKNARLYEMACEVTLARQVQANFFPQTPMELNGYRVFGNSRPATQLGGDYFDYFTIDERYLVVIIADVMGHGIPSALGMTIVKTSVMLRKKDNFDIEKLIETINEALLTNKERKLMVTAQFTVIDTLQHSCDIYHRGHVFPFHRTYDGTWSQYRCVLAPPLGVLKNKKSHKTQIDIKPGERLVFYTDGLYESLGQDEDSEMKLEILQEYLKSRPHVAVDLACADILDHHPSYLTAQPQPDDFTVLILERSMHNNE